MGPSHFVDFNGYSFGSLHAFETPLGRVEVDHLVLKGFPEEAFWDMPHLYEHSLEVPHVSAEVL